MGDAERELLAGFGLSRSQKRTVMEAWTAAPVGLIEVATECRDYGRERGNTGAGLLMHRLTRGDHFDHDLMAFKLAPNGEKRTGWRYVRGTHGSTYVADPDGTDVPPKGSVYA